MRYNRIQSGSTATALAYDIIIKALGKDFPKDRSTMPLNVRRNFGYALHLSQVGEKADNAKVLKGLSSARILEVVESESDGTYRAIYTVRFADTVYVLQCFQKKSVRGIVTPKQELDLIRERLKKAEQEWRALK